MGHNKGKRYRRHSDVLKTVLVTLKSAGPRGMLQTHIMFAIRASHPMTMSYLREIKSNNWAKESSEDCWCITEDGLDALAAMEKG